MAAKRAVTLSANPMAIKCAVLILNTPINRAINKYSMHARIESVSNLWKVESTTKLGSAGSGTATKRLTYQLV